MMPFGGGGPPPILIPPRQRGGGEIKISNHCAKKRRVGNTYGHLGTRLISDLTSTTSPIAIEVVKDGDCQANLARRTVKIEGGNGGKEKGTAPAEHTTAPVYSACLAVDSCCECGPTLMCKTSQCECRKSAPVCVTCRCLGRCPNRAPQTRRDGTTYKGNAEGETGKWGKGRGSGHGRGDD